MSPMHRGRIRRWLDRRRAERRRLRIERARAEEWRRQNPPPPEQEKDGPVESWLDDDAAGDADTRLYLAY